MCCYPGNHGADSHTVASWEKWKCANAEPVATFAWAAIWSFLALNSTIYKNWVHSTLSAHAGLDLLVHLELAFSDVQNVLWQRHLLMVWHLVWMSRWKWCWKAARNRGKKEVKWVAQIKTKTKHVHYRGDATTHMTLTKLQVTEGLDRKPAHSASFFVTNPSFCSCEYSELLSFGVHLL